MSEKVDVKTLLDKVAKVSQAVEHVAVSLCNGFVACVGGVSKTDGYYFGWVFDPFDGEFQYSTKWDAEGKELYYGDLGNLDIASLHK